ncbi:E3 ubiquitin-protein ligase ARIH2-like [Emydura macquarii macquarii]|uniref:E3 ubiquitin-protein ligase ARIH2-like n=1 Tax=Emydura macquarii macquarii TaxID=1129001 RepID=UPI00352A832E
MASGQWRVLAGQFQVICPPEGTPGAGSPGVLRGQVSCGHWVNVAGLHGWVRALLDQGIISFRCPSCPDAPWLWQEVCKLGLFSDEERATLETQILAQEAARGSYRQCPRCQNLIQCLEPTTLRTPCLPCSQRAGKLYCFCWGCRTDWTGPPPQGDSCSNPQCSLQAALYDSPEIQAPGSSVHGCPSLRACPECHALVSHTGQGCSMVECPECWMEFCYRCLRGHLEEYDHEMELEDEEDEDLHDDDYWEAGCTIAGRQELNRLPPNQKLPESHPQLDP